MVDQRKKYIFAILMLTCLLLVTYTQNEYFNPWNDDYQDFQSDSNSLVRSKINATLDGIDTGVYGLGSYDSDGGIYTPYHSQFGLQGFVFTGISKIIPRVYAAQILKMLCSLLMAICVMCVVVLLKKKYNTIAGTSFYLAFWLSPWVTNFAKSIYWVEFTWLLPLIFGLAFVLGEDKKKTRVKCYVGVFASILIKCLCGYEYLTFVMLGAILPLLYESVLAFCNKEKDKIRKYIKQILVMGVVALLGFVVAILIHGYVRGDGNVLVGIKEIYRVDALRRTVGDSDAVGAGLPTSKVTLISSVFFMYLQWNTQMLAGIDGNLFVPLICFSILIMGWNWYHGKKQAGVITAFILALLTSMSWNMLAAAHSYFHGHMNYVCWYYYFIPVCIYVILKH